MQTLSFLGASFFLGVIMTIYLPMNSSVSRYVGSPITASVIFFAVALITALLIFVIAGEYDTISKIKDIPVYLYLTGVISAFMILGTTFLIPKIGARKFFILLVSGQVIMAMIVSHLGILESAKDLITLKKFFGAALVVIGVFISTI
jgi:transporter family-2 protein